MELREFFSEDAIKLDLEGTTKDDILKELIGLLKLDEKSEGMLFKMLKRRENLGSTGIGRGIAIPHCRSLVVNKLRVAFGRKKEGVDFKAIDEKPVNFFFLIVAPPLEVSNQYLPVLGKIAQFSKEPDVPAAPARAHGAEAVPRAARGKGRLAALIGYDSDRAALTRPNATQGIGRRGEIDHADPDCLRRSFAPMRSAVHAAQRERARRSEATASTASRRTSATASSCVSFEQRRMLSARKMNACRCTAKYRCSG